MRCAIVIACALAAARSAHADPSLPRVVTAPTAWLPAEGSAIGSASLDHRGGGSIELGYGLGGLAALALGADDDAGRWQPRACFRVGAKQDAAFDGAPALVLGARVTIGGSGDRDAELYVIASRTLGFARVHAGAIALDARRGASVMGATVRPLAALELVPPQYPRTTLVADLAWLPKDDASAPAWIAGWGVRYQALAWGSIELDVHHREGEGLDQSTVMVRVNGTWDARRGTAAAPPRRSPP